MVATLARSASLARTILRHGWPLLVVLPASIGGTIWWLNEPLGDPSAVRTLPIEPPAAPEISVCEPDTAPRPLAWPDTTLDGDEAKQLLHDVLDSVTNRLASTNTYTASFRKQERVNGVLLPEQTMLMKARNRPFAVYFKFLAPKPGKEVVYAEGRHDNHVIAHNGDWTRRLVPRLRVPVDGAVALADNRHPVTDAGLHNLAKRLLGFRVMDLGDPGAATTLDRAPGPDGRAWPRSLHTHANPKADRPFARVEVLYDPESLIPRQIQSYDWPAPGQAGELLLAEKYCYDDLELDAPLSDLDFDPANPAYEFTRY